MRQTSVKPPSISRGLVQHIIGMGKIAHMAFEDPTGIDERSQLSLKRITHLGVLL